jgi:hypothetical protein
MTDIPTENDIPRGEPNNFQIEHEGPIFQIPSIEFNLSLDRDIIAPINLSPAGDPGHQNMGSGFGPERDLIILVKQSRPGAHDRHLPFDDIDELRQLIETTLP